jgi:hypothetical protein
MEIKSEQRENKDLLRTTYKYNIQQVITYGQQNCKNYTHIVELCGFCTVAELLDCSSIQLSSLILFHENSLLIHNSYGILEGHFVSHPLYFHFTKILMVVITRLSK